MPNSPHFSDAELACHHCGVNGCQQELVDALEALRAIAGVPIKVNDAYRCPEHNAAVGGAPHSEHMTGIAADIVIEGMSPEEMYHAAQQVPAIKGIGVANRQGYIHVDTRTAPARWCYGINGQTCAWDPSLNA